MANLAVATMTVEQRLALVMAENEALRAAAKPVRKLRFQVGQSGGVSVYGLGRFPVTLYREQWEAIFEKADDIQAFIKENSSKLKTK